MDDKNAKEIELNVSQRRVFDFMEQFGSITIYDSCYELGETRLSARIYELKEKGVNIGDEILSVKNRFGEVRHVKRYFIA